MQKKYYYLWVLAQAAKRPSGAPSARTLSSGQIVDSFSQTCYAEGRMKPKPLPKVAVALDPRLRRKAEGAARKARLSLSSWIVRLVTRELGIDWEPPLRGRPPKIKED